MGKLVKREQEIKKIPPKKERPFSKGDYILDPDGRPLRVSKVTKKDFHTEYQSGDEWRSWGSHTWDDPRIGRFLKLDKPLGEYEQEFLQELVTGFQSFQQAPESKSTELMIANGKEHAVSMKVSLQQAEKKLQIFQAMLAMQANKLSAIKGQYQKQIEALTRVIDIIELYLGVYEQIVQIAEGEPAPENEPISFRQLVLHMDEEVGDDSVSDDDNVGADGGIDFNRVEEFDAWMRKYYERVLPEAKGVVIIRPRRHSKDYRLGEDIFDTIVNDELNKENFRTYVLIRNGENIYRIKSDNLRIYPKLFPSKEEMEWLTTGEGNYRGKSEMRWFNEDKAKNQILGYKRNVLMLQGLLDRTNVFKPHPVGLNLLNADTYGNSVRFIYDADSLVTDGKPDFFDWLTNLNSKIKRGHRIFFRGFPYGEIGDRGDRRDRFPIPGWDKDRPQAGMYNVVRLDDYQYPYSCRVKKAFICHFNPKDKVWTTRDKWGYRGFEEHERKVSIPFRLFENDSFIINYEDVNLDDVEFYLNDRVNRQHYLAMMPVLRGIKKQKKIEREWEENFVRFMKGRIKHDDEVKFEQAVWDAIAWWKTKVIEKRALKKEDAKAVRMIEQRVKSVLKG
jgi:hypothetical protein